MTSDTILWIIFAAMVPSLLFLDIFVFGRRQHVITTREALLGTAFWVSMAMLYMALIFVFKGRESGLNFLAGYLIEESLSVDNLFVFLVIFMYFRVPAQFQHRLLFWGIMMALVFRGIFIVLGVAVIERFEFVVYILGAFLVFTGARLPFQKEEADPSKSIFVRLARRVMPVISRQQGSKFFVRRMGRLFATPLFVVLLVIAPTDLMFAVDSVPAVIAIFPHDRIDTLIVYSSNVFAVLGLRALFFALSGVLGLVHYLRYGLAAILVFVGLKMIGSGWPLHLHVSIYVSLGVIVTILTASVIASLVFPARKEEPGVVATSDDGHPVGHASERR